MAKRRPPYIDGKAAWEPIYIGTNEDPFYDERLHWDGRAEKMTQVRALVDRHKSVIGTIPLK